MKKTLVSALTTALVVGAASTTFAAANPFSDVPADHWAYDAVSQLAADGVIEGYGDTTFRGNQNITRYEMAQMIAKAMAKTDVSAADKALIDKLAAEFSDELNNLGVRVSALENRVGNVKLSGDARIRFQHQDTSSEASTGYKKDASWDYRVRVRANAKVNDRTTVTYGISTDDINFADNGAASDNGNIFTDDAKVDYNFGGNHWNLSVGRTDTYVLGGENAYGFQYGDVFDRAELKYTNDHFAATAGYGKFKAGDIAGYALTDDNDKVIYQMDGVKTGYGELEGFFGGGRAAGSALGVYYNDFTVSGGNNGSEIYGDSFPFDDAWGAYASVNFGKWNALANYEKYNSTNSSDNDPEVWVGKLTYGAANFAAPKSWDAWVEYLNADQGFGDKAGNFIGSTDGWRADSLLNNVKSWGVGVDYTFAKNAQFQIMQSFATSAKDGDADPGEETRAQFVFVF